MVFNVKRSTSKHLKKVNSLSVFDVKDLSDVLFASDISGPSSDKSTFPSVSSVV